MRKLFINIATVVLLILFAAIAIILFKQLSSTTQTGEVPFVSPLTVTSPLPTPTKELSAVEAALAFTQQALPALSGTPKVILTRSITYKDYSRLGLGNFSPSTGSQPALQLVLLQGVFDTSKYGMGTKLPFTTATYVVIVYDLDHQSITHVTVSENGTEIKTLLSMAGINTPN